MTRDDYLHEIARLTGTSAATLDQMTRSQPDALVELIHALSDAAHHRGLRAGERIAREGRAERVRDAVLVAAGETR